MEEEPSSGYGGNEKRCVLRSFLKVWTDEEFLMSTGILFHSPELAMGKALSTVLCVFIVTCKRDASEDDRSPCLPGT